MFSNVAPAQRIATEEIFGPVLTVTTFRSEDEAVQKAANSAYGLAAGYGRAKLRASNITAVMRARVVWQNTYDRFDPTAEFGGFKKSRFGRG